MIVPLIPLFLAASINVTERGDWKYGPEVIYNARVDGESPALDSSGRTIIFNTTLKLACRPKSEMIVICTFKKPTVVLTTWKIVEGQRVFENTEEYRERYPDVNIFEMDFDKKNELPLSATGSVDWEKLNFIRALVNELNVPANLTVGTGKSIDIVSSSIIGECKTRYVTSTTKVADDDAKNNEENGLVSIIILPDKKVLKGEILEIQKIQKQSDLDSCFSCGTDKLGVDRSLKSCKSHMIVSESNFTSYTDNEVTFCKGHVQFDGRERTTLTLDKVVPAGGPLPTINDPTKFKLKANKVFFSDSIDIPYETDLYDDWLSLIDYKNNK